MMTLKEIIEPTHEDMELIVQEQKRGKLTLVSFGDNNYGVHIVLSDGPICKRRGQRLVPATYLYVSHLCRRCWLSYRKIKREEERCPS